MKEKHLIAGKPFAALLAVVMTAVLLLSMVHITAGAATQSEINDLKDEAAGIAQEREELEDKLEAIEGDKNQALEQKAILDQQVAALDAEINNVDAQISYYSSLISQKETEIAEAQVKEQEQYELLCQRVRAMEEGGTVSYWSILFNAADFSDLLDRFNLVNEIIDYDNTVMNNLIATREQIEADKAELEDGKAQQEQVKSQKEAAMSELDDKLAEAQALVASIESQSDEYAAAVAALEAEEEEILKEAQRLQAQLDAQNSVPVGDGTYIWPLPAGNYTLTSKFGPRTHPITGKYKNHNGLDIAAPRNTPIYAVASGTVSISTYGSSYGNYVVIYHGNGTSTLYAHMNSRAVSAGQTVTQGQVIGYVGTTGSSTGNHLHLEFQVNGVRKDPESYYPQLDSLFIRRY